MKIVLITLILFTVSCKKKNKSPATSTPTSSASSPVTPTVDPGITPASIDFNQYKAEFLTLAAQMGVTPVTATLTIVYNKEHTTADGFLGVCTTYGNGVKEVSINRVYWEAWATNARKDEMEQLIFHELGHCTLGRAHFNATTTVSGKSVAQSIMNALHISRIFYIANWTYYINELFTPTIAGKVPLALDGNNGWNDKEYASHEAIKTYTMTMQKFSNETDTELGIEEFECDEDIKYVE